MAFGLIGILALGLVLGLAFLLAAIVAARALRGGASRDGSQGYGPRRNEDGAGSGEMRELRQGYEKLCARIAALEEILTDKGK